MKETMKTHGKSYRKCRKGNGLNLHPQKGTQKRGNIMDSGIFPGKSLESHRRPPSPGAQHQSDNSPQPV